MFDAVGVAAPREDPRVAACADMPPGPGMLAALAGIDPGSVSLDDQVTLLQLAERSKAAVEAWQQRVLAAVEYG
ncbi:MAG: hypothetical protein ACRDMV_04835, partial [Streptosporangiales bacterium]